MLIEFINAMFTLQSKKEYVLYEGPISETGYTRVSITRGAADGYNQAYYKIKQIIAEEGCQANIQTVDIPTLEIVYKIIQMALEERETYDIEETSDDARGISEGDDSIITEGEESDESSNINSFIPVVKTQPNYINKVISKSREPQQRIEPEHLYRPDTAPSTNENIQQLQQIKARTINRQTFEVPAGIQDNAGYEELDMFMGGGVKFANLKQQPTSNVQASAEHRSNMESILGGDF